MFASLKATVMAYLIPIVAVLWLASCVGAAWLGWDYRDGKVAQQVKETVNDELQKARLQAYADMETAAERAAADATATERARKTKTAGVRDAAESARSDCVRSDGSVWLLNAAINAANGTPDTSASVLLKLSPSPTVGGRQGLNGTAVGARRD